MDSELGFTYAFSHSVMAQVGRLQFIANGNIESNLLSSINHELRSRLHGIPGTVDYLKELRHDSAQA